MQLCRRRCIVIWRCTLRASACVSDWQGARLVWRSSTHDGVLHTKSGRQTTWHRMPCRTWRTRWRSSSQGACRQGGTGTCTPLPCSTHGARCSSQAGFSAGCAVPLHLARSSYSWHVGAFAKAKWQKVDSLLAAGDEQRQAAAAAWQQRARADARRLIQGPHGQRARPAAELLRIHQRPRGGQGLAHAWTWC